MRGRHRSLGFGPVCPPKGFAGPRAGPAQGWKGRAVGATSSCLSTDCGSLPAELVFCLFPYFLEIVERPVGMDTWRMDVHGPGGRALQGGRAAAL